MTERGTSVDIVEVRSAKAHRLTLIDKEGRVWLTFSRPWWDIASWFWWFLSPGAKRWIILRREGKKTRVRAMKMSDASYRIGG
jgi:hypothetical protein